MTISVPRPASTVVVVRDAPAARAIELLLGRRNDKVAFMAGAYVFPGGRVDDEDHIRATDMGAPLGSPARFPDLTPVEELPYRVAAVREVEEEAAVTLSVHDLVPIAHWVTPEVETRRYDTRFFLARMPDNQIARHDDGETTELVWLTPEDALEQCRGGLIMLPPPTWTTVKRFTRFSSVDQAMAWARETTIVRVQPAFIRDGEKTILTLPGDPLHPTVVGWDVPEDTRFVLEEGRGWKPVPA
jgi:8-oxo-dGTP pyrophosphatase MutT (NUDIX family)